MKRKKALTPMPLKQAYRFFKKYNKWRHGQIDAWSSTERIPPFRQVNRLMLTIDTLFQRRISEVEEWRPKG